MIKGKRLSTDEFILNSIVVHGDKYDYSKVKYINMRTNIILICKSHGEFIKRPDLHLNGSGCRKCCVSSNINFLTFKDNSIKIHGDKYTYRESEYIDKITKMNIFCNIHNGLFKQTPHKHLQGHGCHICNGGILSNLNDFIEKANVLHKNKYLYTKSIYLNSNTKIIIICKEHGDFLQKPNNHLNGKGCPKCIKKFGIKENIWLDYLDVKERQVKIDKYRVDGYNPDTNTIYEFNGDFWHGNPELYNQSDINLVLNKSFGDLYNKTLKKEEDLRKLGYNVISIWENDFNLLSL